MQLCGAELCIINDEQTLYPIYRVKGGNAHKVFTHTLTVQHAPGSASDCRFTMNDSYQAACISEDASLLKGLVLKCFWLNTGTSTLVMQPTGSFNSFEATSHPTSPWFPSFPLCLSWHWPSGWGGQMVSLWGGSPDQRGVWDKHCCSVSAALPICWFWPTLLDRSTELARL